MQISRALIDTLSFSFLRRDRDTSVSGTIRPSTDGVFNLGSDGRRFSYVYADNIVADSFVGSVTGNADTVDNLHAQTTPTPNYLLALDGSSTFPQSVYPNALLVDGSRNLTGNLLVSAGVTIDGVDISAHAGDLNIHVDHTAVTMIAGNGLTGGGDIDASRTFDVVAGDGLTVSADAIALTTPGTLTTSSGNSSAGNHTHIIQSASNVNSPGGVSYILKGNTLGYLGLARLGVGISDAPSYALHVRSTSRQLHLEYDATNYGYLQVDSGGNLSIVSSADIDLAPVGNDVVLSNGQFGIGVSPSYALHVQDTVAQVFMQYDATHFTYLEVTSTGNFYVNSIGNQVFKGITADSDASFYFQANNNCFVQPTANIDNSGPGQAGFILRDYVTNHWGLWKSGSGNLHIFDYSNSTYLLDVTPSGNALWTPTGILEIRKGGEQLRLAYDATYYTQFTVSSSGVLTIDAVGDAVVLQTNNKIGSVAFTSQSVGWEMTYAGNLDCRYIYADELRVKAFTAEVYMSLVGAIVLTKSRGKLSRDFIVPYGEYSITGVDQTDDYFIIDGNYHSTTWPGNGVAIAVSGSTGNNGVYYIDHSYYDSIGDDTWIYVNSEIPSAVGDGTINGLRTFYCEDLEELPGQGVFAIGDYVKLRVMDMSGGGLIVADVWGIIQVYSDQTGGEGAYSYKVIDDGGYYGNRVYQGSIALDYGTSGDGIWEATVLDKGNSPYTQVTTWATDPTVPANYTTWVRTGNLDGIGTLTEQYGIWMGQGTDENNDSQIIMSNLGARIINTDLYVRASGTNRVIASTSGYISAGISAPTTFGTGVGFWAGIDATYAKIMIGNTAGNWLSYDSNTGYLDVKSGANTYGRWDAGTITLGLATGTGGRAVLSSTGVFLYGNNANTVAIQSSGDVRIGRNNSGDAYMEWDANGGTSGGGRLNFRKTASVQLYVDDDGALYSGSRTVKFDSNGISIDAPASIYGAASAFKFYDSFGGNLLGGLYGRWVSASPNANYIHLYAEPISGFGSTVDIEAACTSSAGSYAQGTLHANYNSGAQMAQVSVYANATTGTVTITGLSGISFLGDMQTNYGLAVGTTTNPANGEIFASGDVVMGGGLMVGSTSYTTEVTNGHIWFNDSGLRIYDSGDNYLRIYNSYGTADIGCSSINFLYIGTSTQGVNIGGVLYVNGSIVAGANGLFASYANSVSNAIEMKKHVNDGHVWLTNASNSSYWINYYGNSTYTRDVRIANGAAGWGNIHADNFVNESNSASKRNIRSIKDDMDAGATVLDIVDRLDVKAFEKPNSGSRPNQRRIGLIAEEVNEILPEVIGYDLDGVTPLGIDYGQMVPLLIEAIKELKEEVRRLS